MKTVFFALFLTSCTQDTAMVLPEPTSSNIVTADELWCQHYNTSNSGPDLEEAMSQFTDLGVYFAMIDQGLWTWTISLPTDAYRIVSWEETGEEGWTDGAGNPVTVYSVIFAVDLQEAEEIDEVINGFFSAGTLDLEENEQANYYVTNAVDPQNEVETITFLLADGNSDRGSCVLQ